jgi:hypothetical protein
MVITRTPAPNPSPDEREAKLNRPPGELPDMLAKDPVLADKEARPPGAMPSELSPSLDEQKRPGGQGKGSKRL